MHPEIIKAELKRRGYAQARIAKELGLSNSNIHQAIHGSNNSERIVSFIERILGKTRFDLWPDRFVARFDTPINEVRA